MPYATGPRGARIHYRVFGDTGPFVVLLQGLGLSGRFWFDVPELVADAERPHRVLVPDNRGTGGSDRPRVPWRMRHMADDVAAVLDHAGADRAIVVGISMGGMIAQHVALRHGHRLDGLVLMATTPGLPHGRLPSPRTVRTLLSLPFLAAGGGSVDSARLLLPQREVRHAKKHFARWPEALRHDPIRPRSFFMQLAAALAHSTGTRLERIGCPTVVVHGAEDILIPPQNSELLARRIPDAQLVLLPGVAHAIPALDPDSVRRAVLRL